MEVRQRNTKMGGIIVAACAAYTGTSPGPGVFAHAWTFVHFVQFRTVAGVEWRVNGCNGADKADLRENDELPVGPLCKVA